MKSIYTFLNKKKKLKKEDVWYVVQELIKGNSSISLVDKEKIDKIGYISGGPYGVLYESTFDGRTVVFKRMREGRSEMGNDLCFDFVEEVYNLAITQGHKSVINLYGVTYSEYPLKLGIITELADITLQKYVETHHPLNPFKVIDISLQICRGLKHLHSKGIVHQQLCPKKTLMKSETVLFTDFGVSKWGDNMNMGRPVSIRFMAPEQITSGFDFQADIFSFAMMFWFLKTGKNPFHEKTESMAATCFQRAERETIPDEWSEREKKLVEGCWNQSPSERMMCDDIEKLLVEMLREIN